MCSVEQTEGAAVNGRERKGGGKREGRVQHPRKIFSPGTAAGWCCDADAGDYKSMLKRCRSGRADRRCEFQPGVHADQRGCRKSSLQFTYSQFSIES